MSIRIKLKKQPPIIKKSLNILLIKNDKPNESQYSLLKVDRIRHVAEVASRKWHSILQNSQNSLICVNLFLLNSSPVAEMHLCWRKYTFEVESSPTVLERLLYIDFSFLVFFGSVPAGRPQWLDPLIFNTRQMLPFSLAEQVPFQLVLKSSAFLSSDSFSKRSFNVKVQYEKPQDSWVIWILKWNFISGLEGSISSHRFLRRLTIIESFWSWSLNCKGQDWRTNEWQYACHNVFFQECKKTLYTLKTELWGKKSNKKNKNGNVGFSTIHSSLHSSSFCMWIWASFPPYCNSIKKYD